MLKQHVVAINKFYAEELSLNFCYLQRVEVLMLQLMRSLTKPWAAEKRLERRL